MPETKLEPRTPRAEPAPQQPKSHGLALKDRRHLAVTGVSRVISCDENTAVLETPLGNLTIGGQELQIGELSTQSGQVQLSGKIEYLQYAENQQSGGGLLAGCSADGPCACPLGRAGGCPVVPGAGVPAGRSAGCSAPGAGGRKTPLLFAGCRLFRRSGGSHLWLCGRDQRRRIGPLVHERRSAAGGAVLALGRAARRTPGGVNAGGAAARPAARSPQNAAAAAAGSRRTGPHGAQKPQNCKKIPENPKFRRKTVAKAVDNII